MPRSIPIPTIKFGKLKERSQICEIMTDDGRWIDQELPVLNSCVDWEEVGLAFILDPQNQYLAEDNQWHQLLAEKSLVPLCLREESIFQDGQHDEEDLKKLSDQISNLRFEQVQAEQFEARKQSAIWNKITWIISIVCGTMLLIAGMSYLGG